MFKINDNYQKLPGSYLFSTIAKLLLKQCTKQSMRWDMQKRFMAMRRILDMTF